MPKIVFVLLATLTLAACNTMQGAGDDVSAAGDALSDQAAETQSEM
jgi:entericidin B